MLSFRPTLIIGLGGSGTFVVRRLKKRLRRLVEFELPPSVQLLAFDTDGQTPRDLLEELPPMEFFRLSNFNAGNYTTDAARVANPAIASFWKYRRFTPGWVQDGASQHPPVGRLALFVHFDIVVRQVSAAIERMFRPTRDYNPPPNIHAVDVYVVGSSCGGTGAGMFFDMALLSRYLVTQTTREPILQGHVFMPSCFGGTQTSQSSLQTNAWAFLQTAEAMQSAKLPRVLYPGFQTEEYPAPLFSRVHLISGVDMTGIRANDLQDTYEKVALQLDLEVSGAASRDMRSAIDNCATDFNNRPGGRLAVYSSYGAAIISGSSSFSRLSILPALCGRVMRALATDRNATAEDVVGATIQNQAFVRMLSAFESDDAALELVPEFQPEVKRVIASENPVEAARGLVRRVDTLASTTSFSWLSSLSQVPEEMRNAVLTRVETGTGGIQEATAYLQRAKAELQRLNERAATSRMAQADSADQIISKVSRMFTGGDEKKRILQTEGYAFLKSQTLIRVREALARKVQAYAAGWLEDVSAKLERLDRFNTSAQAFIEAADRYSQGAKEKYQATVGADSVIEDSAQILTRFEVKAEDTSNRFTMSPEGRRALNTLARALLKGDGADAWGGTMLQAADEFLSQNLADSVAIPPDWPQRAAQEIVSCQPMVQFVADHLNSGPRPERFVYARAYGRDRVLSAVEAMHPELHVSIEDAKEPGALEVGAMALNFALFQIQETRLIESGYRQFCNTHPEPVENRYAWRGPAEFWSRIAHLNLFPITTREQALARVLALYPLSPALPVVTITVGGFLVKGDPLDVDVEASQSAKYQSLNRTLVSNGYAEDLVREWNRCQSPDQARQHLQELLSRTQERIRRAEDRIDDEGGPAFCSMLEEERAALDFELKRAQI